MTNEFHDRVALVTGGSRGIGRAIALALAEAGAAVAVNYRRSENEAYAVVREIAGRGGRAQAFRADVSEPDEVTRLVASVKAALGGIEILINNAGMSKPQKPEDISLEDWNETLRVNLTSAFLLIQAVLPAMRQAAWGRIVNLSSVAAYTGGVVGPHYTASKAGLIGLTHAYAAALVRDGITVNAIAPALIDTDMVRANPRIRPDLIPQGRFGTAEEVAEAALLLVRNGFMTGQTIQVNGGYHFS